MRAWRRSTNPAAACIVLLSLTLGACAHRPADDPADPLEPVNRVVFKVNDNADHYVLRPIAKGYDYAVPGLARRGITNFFLNLAEPKVIVNDLLQTKFVQGGQDLLRFLFNSTVGLAGLIDVATDNGLPQHDEDFGQTLGYWGVGEGWYLVLPLLGPSDNRDMIGFFGDRPLNVGFWLDGDHDWLTYSLYGADLINFRANLLSTDSLINQQFDKYLFFRTAYLQRRQALIYDGNPPPEDLGIDDISEAPAPAATPTTGATPAQAPPQK